MEFKKNKKTSEKSQRTFCTIKSFYTPHLLMSNYWAFTTHESCSTNASRFAKRSSSDITSPDKLLTKSELKQLAQVEEHIWDVLTPLVIEATAAVKTAVLILIDDILVQERDVATTLPEAQSKDIVACVLNVQLGDKNIFCKYTKEFETFGVNTKSADENKSTADAHKRNKAKAFKTLFLLSISDCWIKFLRTNMINIYQIKLYINYSYNKKKSKKFWHYQHIKIDKSK